MDEDKLLKIIQLQSNILESLNKEVYDLKLQVIFLNTEVNLLKVKVK